MFGFPSFTTPASLCSRSFRRRGLSMALLLLLAHLTASCIPRLRLTSLFLIPSHKASPVICLRVLISAVRSKRFRYRCFRSRFNGIRHDWPYTRLIPPYFTADAHVFVPPYQITRESRDNPAALVVRVLTSSLRFLLLVILAPG